MTTKKTSEPPPVTTEPKVERGRYARLLADGYVVEVTPTEKAPPKVERPTASHRATSGR